MVIKLKYLKHQQENFIKNNMENIKIIEYPYFLHDNLIWRKHPREIVIFPHTVNCKASMEEVIEYDNINYHFIMDGDIIFVSKKDVYETKEELLKKLGEKHNL